MSIATRRYTYQDLLHTPDDGKRYEVIDGELFVTASPAKLHVWLSNAWTFWLTGHVKERDLGEVYQAPVDAKFLNEDTIVPDIIFIRKDRLHIFRGSYIDEAPDLLIEIHSPSTKKVDLGEKLALYQRFGVPEYWTADTDLRQLTIRVLNADGTYEQVRPNEGRLCSTVLPELEIDLAEVFRGLPQPVERG